MIKFLTSIKLILSNLFCSHNWRYWHVKLTSDKRSINGTVLHNKYRRCEKCKKQQSFKMIPKNSRWDPSSIILPENKDTIDVEANILGSTPSKRDIRDKLLDQLLNN